LRRSLWTKASMSDSFSEFIPCSSGVEVRQPSVGQYAGSSPVMADAMVDVGSAGTGVSVGSVCAPPHPVINSTIIAKQIVFRQALLLSIVSLLSFWRLVCSCCRLCLSNRASADSARSGRLPGLGIVSHHRSLSEFRTDASTSLLQTKPIRCRQLGGSIFIRYSIRCLMLSVPERHQPNFYG
jgi:hypothetical protein